jgi:mannose-6-phosphate isomerase-like protein (cupin superfamily)
MRLLVFGVDASGRSCIVEQSELPFAQIPGLLGSKMAKLFSTDQSPPPARPPGVGAFLPGLPPGHVSWYMIEHEPPIPGVDRSAATRLHHRDVTEMIVFLAGSAEMILGDGRHLIEAGDCIVMPGIDHGMQPGPKGCRLMAFAIGSTPL